MGIRLVGLRGEVSISESCQRRLDRSNKALGVLSFRRPAVSLVRTVRFVRVRRHRPQGHGHDGTSMGSHEMAPIAQPEDGKRPSPEIRIPLGWWSISGGWRNQPDSGYPQSAI